MKKNFGSGTRLLTTGIVCLSFLFCGCAEKSKKKTGEREIRVKIQKITKRNFRRQIPVQGTVYPVDYAALSAKTGGTLDYLIAEGKTVKKGGVLYEIDRKVLTNQVVVREDEIRVKEAALQTALASKESAVLSGKKAELSFQRAKKLRDSKAISEAEFEEHETNYKKAMTDVTSADAAIANAKAQLKQAESNLSIAKKNLDDSVQTAPYDCTVVETFMEQNEYVSTGKEILKIENLDSLELICYISSVYYDEIETGKTRVEISADGKKKGEAVVTFKAPSIDPQSRTFKVKALIPKGFSIVSGMLCAANIILEEKEAYGLPADAFLLRANNRYIVYAAEGNRARSFEVKPGILDGTWREILEPDKLLQKDIVVSGQSFVNTGALLRTTQTK